MTADYDIQKIADRIEAIKAQVMELKEQSAGIPAVENNADRILASIKMLEINISDIAGLD
jgi:hypothetical protein